MNSLKFLQLDNAVKKVFHKAEVKAIYEVPDREGHLPSAVILIEGGEHLSGPSLHLAVWNEPDAIVYGSDGVSFSNGHYNLDEKTSYIFDKFHEMCRTWGSVSMVLTPKVKELIRNGMRVRKQDGKNLSH